MLGKSKPGIARAGGKTAESILASCGARLAPFDIKELRGLMEYDELELDTPGDGKPALSSDSSAVSVKRFCAL